MIVKGSDFLYFEEDHSWGWVMKSSRRIDGGNRRSGGVYTYIFYKLKLRKPN